ncbi:MAG: hypothetical protein V2I36_06735 [Desulfopila sp.]|jgi:hypothetical protein|nr:hypothetical protein [Desulfopila sp.]
MKIKGVSANEEDFGLSVAEKMEHGIFMHVYGWYCNDINYCCLGEIL